MKTNMESDRDKLLVFRERFNSLRGELTQKAFSEKIGISRPTVGAYENGERVPDALTLRNIAEICEVSTDWLLGLTDDKKGDASVMAIERTLGLTPSVQERIKLWKMLDSEGGFYLCMDIVIALLDSAYFTKFINESSKYLQYSDECAFIEMKYKDKKFIRKIEDAISFTDAQDTETYSEQDKMIHEKYKNAKGNQDYHYFKAQQCILDFMRAYTNAFVELQNQRMPTMDDFLLDIQNQHRNSKKLDEFTRILEEAENNVEKQRKHEEMLSRAARVALKVERVEKSLRLVTSKVFKSLSIDNYMKDDLAEALKIILDEILKQYHTDV